MPLGRQNINFQASLAQLNAGGLPTRAQLRLAEEAGPHRKLFTSDLSVSELLLTGQAACEPISQVMGSSIYQIGRIADYKGATEEITMISDAHRNSRRLAISRLYQEAQLVRADAVVGVRLSERYITMGDHGKGGDDGGEIIEFTVVGTAVRAPWITHPPEQPVITDLSGQDVWALYNDGFEPCGFLFEFCRYHVWHVMKDFQQSGGGGEITAARDAVDTARRIVGQKIVAQADQFKSQFVVGSEIKLDVHEVPCGYGGCPLNDLDIDVSWFGTGVRRIPGYKQATHANIPPLILSMMPLGRRRAGDVVEEEDEDEEIREEAREAEERAAEKDDEGNE
jgi:uncharacterized protein YbjQ (UPF0145 family)